MSQVDYFEWIMKVIMSCTELKQTPACNRLIEQYHKRIGSWYETSLLEDCLNERINQIWITNPDLRKRYTYGS